MNTHFEEELGVRFLVFDSFVESGLVTHCFTTRTGGVSQSPFDSLNLGLTAGDREEDVLRNRELLGKIMGAYPEESILLEHGSDVHVLRASGGSEIPVADSVITGIHKAPLTIFYADCVPLFILDRATPAIGLAHGGWRGTLKNVAGTTCEKMKCEFGTKMENCIVGIGPSIGPCCFLVDEDVESRFEETFSELKDLMHKTSNNKWSIDLWRINRRLFLMQGVPEENITVSSLCTSCEPGMFFSFRRDKRRTGRMAAMLMLL